ncbi:FHA domain-containing protein [bacterium D16-54]|nr:FHA domain-containing protein [bacterium D16-54]RKJ16923.1 FHA domain-containing protein [bacterium D16-56]
MDLQSLCTSCLLGILKNGVCTYCHKSIQEASSRPAGVLPDRYMLASRYYLGRVIGNGGFGITYLAWDCLEKRRVIVKELFPRQDVQRTQASGDITPVKGQEEYFEKLKQRFKEEALVLYNFRHEPSIMNVYQLMEENNTVYYSMEYLTGVDLKTYINQNGRLSWSMMSGYVKRLLYILRILHSQGLIHRDISPDNIFLTSVTDAKLIDFGSVRCFNNGQGLTTILKQVYAPVEQYFSNGNQGPWTDIYSLSVTIYHALSGQRPPKAPDRMKRDETIPIEKYCPDLPEHVTDAIMKGMALRDSERFQSAQAMAEKMFPGEDVFSSDQCRRTDGNPYRAGSKQYRAVRQPEQAGAGFWLQCAYGRYQGQRFFVSPNTSITFGRDSQCTIIYPADTPGISRRHFCLWCDQHGKLFIQDENSTYGTMVSGRRIEPGKWYQLKRGNTISFGNENYRIEGDGL